MIRRTKFEIKTIQRVNRDSDHFMTRADQSYLRKTVKNPRKIHNKRIQILTLKNSRKETNRNKKQY